MLHTFEEGDIVTPLDHGVDNAFYGVVQEVNGKENKVYVLWSGGKISQHDPSEIHLYSVLNSPDTIQRRYRAKLDCDFITAADANNPSEEEYAGNPKTHGLEAPVAGGTDVMQRLVRKLRHESIENAGIVNASIYKELRSRRAVYHRSKGRIYQRSKVEQDYNLLLCSKCKTSMEEHSFTRGIHLYICPSCGWKITSDKIL